MRHQPPARAPSPSTGCPLGAHWVPTAWLQGSPPASICAYFGVRSPHLCLFGGLRPPSVLILGSTAGGRQSPLWRQEESWRRSRSTAGRGEGHLPGGGQLTSALCRPSCCPAAPRSVPPPDRGTVWRSGEGSLGRAVSSETGAKATRWAPSSQVCIPPHHHHSTPSPAPAEVSRVKALGPERDVTAGLRHQCAERPRPGSCHPFPEQPREENKSREKLLIRRGIWTTGAKEGKRKGK